MKKLVELLDSWMKLNGSIMGLTEEQVHQLLKHEVANRNRLTFALRLHSRLSKLRHTRERKELVK